MDFWQLLLESFASARPDLALSPDQVILHVGTNDLKQKELKQVADSIVDLARQIENSSDASITISELFSRRDHFNEAEGKNITIDNYKDLYLIREQTVEIIFSDNTSINWFVRSEAT